jgi:acetyl-CoA C-acetyltransferase
MTQNQKSSNNVLVLGVGLTPVGEHWEKSIRELALEAIHAASIDTPGLKPQALYVANMMAPRLSGQSQLAALISDFAGLRGIEAITLEAAGASGGVAIRQAYLALTSGLIDVALVVGVEKITERATVELEAALTTASDADHEAVHGVTATAQAALLMRRYLHEHNAPQEALAGFSINAHANAVTNPYAIYRRPIRAENYTQSSMVSEPINLLDAAPLADGAAALVLSRVNVIPENLSYPQVRIVASAAVSTTVALHDRPDPLTLTAAVESVKQCFHQTHLTLDEIDFFELHDRYSIFAALSLEAAGFAKRGRGWCLSQDETITRDGHIPICTFGGSKARGDTGGATGVYQVAEATLQLQNRAGDNQVPNAKVGMTQCLGGSGATAVTHILKQENEPGELSDSS